MISNIEHQTSDTLSLNKLKKLILYIPSFLLYYCLYLNSFFFKDRKNNIKYFKSIFIRFFFFFESCSVNSIFISFLFFSTNFFFFHFFFLNLLFLVLFLFFSFSFDLLLLFRVNIYIYIFEEKERENVFTRFFINRYE